MTTKVTRPLIADDILDAIGDAIAQGTVPLWSTHVGLPSLPIKKEIRHGYLWGFYEGGDGGGKQIRRVHGNTVTDPANPRWVRSKDRYLPDGDVEDDAFGGWWELIANGPDLTPRQFGAKGDAIVDDRAAIIYADTYAHGVGSSLYFTAGVYRLSDGVDKKANWVGDSAPQLAPFPLSGDDKKFLRPGYKHLLPGSVLLFTGTGKQSIKTQRSDDFANITYCVRETVTGSKMSDIAIVLDVDVYNAPGSLTAFGADNSASYDVGHLVDDVAQTLHRDVVVFGYFPVGGTVVRSVVGNDDPDYTIFRGGSTMGWRGLALIGSENNDGSDAGLSGTQAYGLDIFCSADHHSRSTGTAPTIYAGAASARCVYIDGYTKAINDDINGHYFFGGCVRSYVNHTVEFDCCSNAAFSMTVFETPTYGVSNSSKTAFLASSQTNDIAFKECRFSNDAGLGESAFIGQMSGYLTITGRKGLGFGLLIAENKGGVAYWTKISSSGSSGDPSVQFGSGPFSSSTAGWSIRRDIDASDILDFRWNGTSVNRMYTDGGLGMISYKSGGTKIIVAGSITIGGYSYYSVDTEGAAATDDLDTINGGSRDGQILILRAANSSRDVVIVETGNLRLAGAFTLNNSQDRITLQFDGINWIELSRSDNS